MTDETLSREELRILAKRADLDLPPEYFEELIDAYGHVQAMVSRLPRNRARGDEPAHVFNAATYLPQEG